MLESSQSELQHKVIVGNKRKKGSEEKKAKLSSEPVPANPPPYQSSYVPQYVQPPEERKLAPSAQMLHYQYKRDQLHNADAQINNLDGSPSGNSSDVEDTRVYESAGLAQAPLFSLQKESYSRATCDVIPPSPTAVLRVFNRFLAGTAAVGAINCCRCFPSPPFSKELRERLVQKWICQTGSMPARSFHSVN
ncbi:unnamed protein product [Schistocephalus solidus]|uniref:Uncharacterized protein n=1 Tax=Schistocephalus solidus TaxID=70667 RepID=A0A183SJW8_SCHSO|nr:unnamed protein product [Schistocephalus solidus]